MARADSGDRILILTADTGWGHRAIANAIAEALAAVVGQRYVIQVLNPFFSRYCTPALSGFLGLYGPVVRNTPGVYAIVWKTWCNRLTNRCWIALARSQLLPALSRLVADRRVRAVISTHSVIPPLIVPLVERSNPDCLTVSVVTELGYADPGHAYPGISRYIAMTARVADCLRRAGVPSHQIGMTGHIYSIRRLEAAVRDHERTRAQYGIPASRRLVLFAGGGEGAGTIRGAIEHALRGNDTSAYIAVTGSNHRLHKKLASSVPYERVIVLGWTSDFVHLIAASDVLVTKAGAATLTEAIAANTRLVIVGHLPGQEQCNAKYIAESGHGIVARSPREAASALNQWHVRGKRQISSGPSKSRAERYTALSAQILPQLI